MLLRPLSMTFRSLISLIDAEIQNPKILHSSIGKLVSQVRVMKRMKKVHITVRFVNMNEIFLCEA